MATVAPKRITTKKRCCKDRPRCKKCPVVWKRLENAGLAEREDRRHYVPDPDLRKRDLKAARKGRVAA